MTDVPPGVTRWDGPPLEAWEAWTPAEAAARLRDAGVPWCVVGGWSIDLFLGEETRHHEDLEVAVRRPHWRAVRRALGDGFVLHAVGDGEVRALGAGEEPRPETHQSWALDVAADRWRIDVMIEPGDDRTWVYRRDESLTAPRAFMEGRTPDGITYLRPHGALFFKAKDPRPKDEHDLDVALPRLAADERAWLVDALRRFHPAHPWLDRI